MNDLVAVVLIIVLALSLTQRAVRNLPHRVQLVHWLALPAHVFSTFAQRYVGYSIYGVSDMRRYFRSGHELEAALSLDFGRFAPDALSLVFHGTPDLPFFVFGAGTSTGSLSAITGWLLFLCHGSEHGAGLALALCSFAGNAALFRAVRPLVHPSLHVQVAVATMLVPSVVYWSSGIVKEAVVFAGLGWLILGLRMVIEDKHRRGWLLVLLGGAAVSTTKAYVLFPAAIGAGLWYGLRSRPGMRQRLRPIHLALGGVFGVAAVAALGQVFPRFAFDTFAEQAATLQSLGTQTDGGSDFSLNTQGERTLAGQLAYAPMAILSALFRPTLFEVRNLQMFINTIETSAITVMAATVVFRRSLRRALQTAFDRPHLAFASVYVFLLALGVGLTTTNLGTLSRYRTPLVPLFLLLLIVLRAETRPSKRVRSSAGAVPATREERP